MRNGCVNISSTVISYGKRKLNRNICIESVNRLVGACQIYGVVVHWIGAHLKIYIAHFIYFYDNNHLKWICLSFQPFSFGSTGTKINSHQISIVKDLRNINKNENEKNRYTQKAIAQLNQKPWADPMRLVWNAGNQNMCPIFMEPKVSHH